MKKDTILFILSEIEKELQNADIEKQLYLIERRDVNLNKLKDMEEDKQKFNDVVKTQIQQHEQLNKIYFKYNLELFKVLIDINLEHIENLEMLIGES